MSSNKSYYSLKLNLLINGYIKENCTNIIPTVIIDVISKWYSTQPKLLISKKRRMIDILRGDEIEIKCNVEPAQTNKILQISHYDVGYVINNKEIIPPYSDDWITAIWITIYADKFAHNTKMVNHNSIIFIAFNQDKRVLTSKSYNINGVIKVNKKFGLNEEAIAIICNDYLDEIRVISKKKGIFALPFQYQLQIKKR